MNNRIRKHVTNSKTPIVSSRVEVIDVFSLSPIILSKKSLYGLLLTLKKNWKVTEKHQINELYPGLWCTVLKVFELYYVERCTWLLWQTPKISNTIQNLS